MVAHYGSAKGFVQSMSKALAYEWGPQEIRINFTLFLASERAAHLTGQLISVSGGAYMP